MVCGILSTSSTTVKSKPTLRGRSPCEKEVTKTLTWEKAVQRGLQHGIRLADVRMLLQEIGRVSYKFSRV